MGRGFMPVPDLSKFRYEAEGVKEVDRTSIVQKKRRKVEEKEVEKITAGEAKEAEAKVVKRGEEIYHRAVSANQSSAKTYDAWPGPLPPILEPGMSIVFVGFNPGTESARQGHYYAHPSNRFWKFLFWSKITPLLHHPAEDSKMPQMYRIGFTDLVSRTTKGIKQLTPAEMHRGADSLEARLASVQPESVCLVGKGIWEAIAKARKWDRKKFRYGRDFEHRLGGAALFCVPSTSGLNSIPAEVQLRGWNELKSVTDMNIEQ